MDRNEIVWVLECCMLNLDGVSKRELVSYGATEQEAEMGIKLYDYLKEREIKRVMEVKNGY